MLVKGYNSDWLEELKSKNDIVDVISSYVPSLQRKGNNYWGLCPFHHEKTPSFSVNPDGGYYHCFGCSDGGDVISFVMKVENVEFFDAVEILADRVGMKIPEMSVNQSSADFKKKRDRLLTLTKEAAKHYYSCLKVSKEANDYIGKRGILPATAIKFGIGYSDGYNGIINALIQKGYKRDEMLEAGVIEERNGSFFDAMAGRLVFPIMDAFGNVIAFGGRSLVKTDFAKYKNTKETMLFTKNKVLYGLNYIKKLRLTTKVEDLIIVEGYMDTLAIVQAGVANVVASMGTALTEAQAKLLKRYVEQVFICYDGDSAGQHATMRGLDILRKQGLKVRVISLPENKDPDEMIIAYGVDGFNKYKNSALELIEHKLVTLKEKYDFTTPDGRAGYAKAASLIVSELDTEVEREVYYSYVSAASGVSADVIKRQTAALQTTEQPKAEIKPPKVTSAAIEATRFILHALLFGTQKGVEDISGELISDNYRAVYSYILECYLAGKGADPGLIYQLTTEEEANAIINLDISKYSGNEKIYYKDCLKLLKKEYSTAIISELSNEYTESTNEEEKAEIIKKIAEIKAKAKF